MNVIVGDRWKPLLRSAVDSGRFASEVDVVSEGLRLVQEREERCDALRAHLEDAVALGGAHSHEEVWASVDATLNNLRKPKAAA